MDKRTPEDKACIEYHIRELRELVKKLKYCHERGHETAKAVNKAEVISTESLVLAELVVCTMYHHLIELLEAKIEFLASIDKRAVGELPKEFKIPDKLSEFMKGGGHCGN